MKRYLQCATVFLLFLVAMASGCTQSQQPGGPSSTATAPAPAVTPTAAATRTPPAQGGASPTARPGAPSPTRLPGDAIEEFACDIEETSRATDGTVHERTLKIAVKKNKMRTEIPLGDDVRILIVDRDKKQANWWTNHDSRIQAMPFTQADAETNLFLEQVKMARSKPGPLAGTDVVDGKPCNIYQSPAGKICLWEEKGLPLRIELAVPGVGASTVEEWTHISVGNVPDSLFELPVGAGATAVSATAPIKTPVPTPTADPKATLAAAATATAPQAQATRTVAAPLAWRVEASGTSETLMSVSMASPEEAWAVGSSGTMLHYWEGEWQPVEPLVGERLDAVTVYPFTREAWAVGDAGSMLYFSFEVWEPMENPSGLPMMGLGMSSQVDGWAVGLGGTILHISNGSASEVENPAFGSDRHLHAVAASREGEAWAVGELSTLLHYKDEVWELMEAPVEGEFYSVAIAPSGEVWVVGSYGVILRYVKGQWQAVTSPTDRHLYGVAMVSAGEGWAVGEEGTILHYVNGSWHADPSPTEETLYGVSCLSPTQGWAVGASGTLLRLSAR